MRQCWQRDAKARPSSYDCAMRLSDLDDEKLRITDMFNAAKANVQLLDRNDAAGALASAAPQSAPEDEEKEVHSALGKLEMAGAAGHAKSNLMLGDIYYGVRKLPGIGSDGPRALKYYLKAAASGDKRGAFNAAHMQLEGRVVAHDLDRAHALAIQAKHLGQKGADALLERIEKARLEKEELEAVGDPLPSVPSQ